MILTLRQAVHTWYRLSCGHVAHRLHDARGNTTDCVPCLMDREWPRVFILETVHIRPDND